MQQCFRDAARKKTDNDVPDKMKHDFLLFGPPMLRSSAAIADRTAECHAKFVFPRSPREKQQNLSYVL
jgi:hypothetical protein